MYQRIEREILHLMPLFNFTGHTLVILNLGVFFEKVVKLVGRPNC